MTCVVELFHGRNVHYMDDPLKGFFVDRKIQDGHHCKVLTCEKIKLIFCSQKTKFIDPKQYMNSQWMVLYKI